VHEKILEKHGEDIEEIKFEIVTNKKGDHKNGG
jgi:AhpD family alkylhydroperoxidase